MSVDPTPQYIQDFQKHQDSKTFDALLGEAKTDGLACELLTKVYLNGVENGEFKVKADSDMARKFAEQGIKLKNPFCSVYLARHLLMNDDISANKKQIEELLIHHKEANSAEVAYLLGVLYDNTGRKNLAKVEIQKASRMGHIAANRSLCALEIRDFNQKYQTAFEQFRTVVDAFNGFLKILSPGPKAAE